MPGLASTAGLYTMQGRLSPPEDGRFQCFPRQEWAAEIESAPLIPLRGIEWIYDLHGQGVNPLETAAGRAELTARLRTAGIDVVSICADYFMDCPLVGVDRSLQSARIEQLKWLVSICPEMGITRIVLPFVDSSRIASASDANDALHALADALPEAASRGVQLHLETDLNPGDFRAFLADADSPMIRVNYDSGNSGSLGYLVDEEFAAYGDRIGSFHIKDRLRGGGTVPLGRGNVDFARLRSALIDIDYRGDFVLQVARDAPGDEINWLKHVTAVAASWLQGIDPVG